MLKLSDIQMAIRFVSYFDYRRGVISETPTAFWLRRGCWSIISSFDQSDAIRTYESVAIKTQAGPTGRMMPRRVRPELSWSRMIKSTSLRATLSTALVGMTAFKSISACAK